MRARAVIRLVVLGALLHGIALPVAAQQPPPPPPPPVPPPIVTDTSDLTAGFLAAGAEVRRIVPTPPRPGTDGLLPAGSRMVFNRDSIEWSSAGSVAELLQQVPGLHLLRGYWIGTPQIPLYRGQVGTGIEYFLDGVPYLPIGDDSTTVDPSLLPLSFYESIEVERLPAGLRVHLFTRRHDRAAPRTRVAVGTGDLEISRYQGSLEKRFPSGLGFSGAFDFLSVGALATNRDNDYQNTNAWLQASWVRGPRSGITVQYFLSGPIRRPGFASSLATDTIARPLDESRRDLQARVYLRGRTDGLGSSLDLIASRTTWAVRDSALMPRDSLAAHDRALTQIGAIAGYRTPVATASVSAFRRDDWTTLDLLAQGGFTPDDRFAVHVEAGQRRHSGDRSSKWVMGRGSLRLPLGLVVSAAWKVGDVVDQPMLEADSARKVDDRSVMVGWETRLLGLEAGYARTSAATPATNWTWPTLGVVGRTGTAEWITAHARLTPKNWFTLDGWHSRTRGGTVVEGQPPTHSMVTAAIRSKFLRVYSSGFFELKAAATVESWGTGTLGRDSVGDPVILKGATFMRAQFQMQFGSFTAYWDRQNLLNQDREYAPGIRALAGANTFGIRWVFWN